MSKRASIIDTTDLGKALADHERAQATRKNKQKTHGGHMKSQMKNASDMSPFLKEYKSVKALFERLSEATKNSAKDKKNKSPMDVKVREMMGKMRKLEKIMAKFDTKADTIGKKATRSSIALASALEEEARTAINLKGALEKVEKDYSSARSRSSSSKTPEDLDVIYRGPAI